METYSQNDWRSYHLSHSSQWVDENGNNTSAYNHKYWEENKDDIKARRALLKAMRDGKYYDDDADSYIKDITDSVSKYIEEKRAAGEMTDEEMRQLQEELKQEIESVEKKKSGQKNPNNKKEESKSSDEDEDEDDDKKKGKGKSGSSGGSSSSKKKSSDKDKKSSSKSGAKGGSTGTKPKAMGKLGDPAKDRAKEEKAAKAAEKEAGGGSGKSSSEESKSKSSEKDSSSKESTKKETEEEKKDVTNTAEEPTEEESTSSTKDISGVLSEDNPINSYSSFIKEIREKTGASIETADEGLELWKAYREKYGLDVGDEEAIRAEAEEEAKRNKTLKHGLELFDEYLEHHGRLNQKWGVRNGPPYPLNQDQLTSAYKRNGGMSDSAREVYGSGRSTAKYGAKKGTVKGSGKGGSGYDEKKYTKKKTTDGAELAKDARKALAKVKKAVAPTIEKIRKSRENERQIKEKLKASNLKGNELNGAKEDLEYMSKKDRQNPEKIDQMIKSHKEKQPESYDLKTQTKLAIDRGDANFAKEHFSELTNQEINDILSRVSLNQRVEQALGNTGNGQNGGGKQSKSWKEKDFSEKVDILINGADKVRGWIDKGTNVWNTTAKLYNAFHSDDPLPTIDANAVSNAAAAAKKAKVNQMIKDLGVGKMSFDKFVKEADVDSVNAAKNYMTNLNTIKSNSDTLKKTLDAMSAETSESNDKKGLFNFKSKSKDEKGSDNKTKTDNQQNQPKQDKQNQQNQPKQDKQQNQPEPAKTESSSGDSFLDGLSDLGKRYVEQQTVNQKAVEENARVTQDAIDRIEELERSLDELREKNNS